MTEHAILLDELAGDRGSHSVFSPSSSSMWMNCPGSLIPNIQVHDSAGEAAAEGTVAHGVAEQWLKSGKKPTHLIGTNEFVESGDWGYLIEIDSVMLNFVQDYVDWCAWLPGDHMIEQKVYFSEITPIPNQGGTADHVACEPGRMVITDLKYGKGVKVYAEGNTQALLYALGFFLEWDWFYDFQEIVIRIAQPRLEHFDEWVIDRERLLEFAEYAKCRAHDAWRLDAPRRPSESACQWCKVKATCPAAAKMSIDLMAAAFDSVGNDITAASMSEFREDYLSLTVEPSLADIGSLTVDEMVVLYEFRKMAEGWWAALAAELYRRAVDGEPIPRHKLVESRSHRVFTDEPEAAKKLQSYGLEEGQIWNTKMNTPSQVEKELRKAGYPSKDIPGLLSGLVFKPVGKPTLAPVTDKRPALVDVSGAAFGDLT